jgi:phage terminase large subunit-like protein
MNRYLSKRDRLLLTAKALYTLKLRKMMNPLRYFSPQDYQVAFWLSFLKLKLIFGGNRSGKTMNGAAYVIDKCVKNPGTIAWACTWAKLSTPIQQKKIKELLPVNEIKYAKWSEQRGFAHKIIIFRNGSMIRFKTYEEGVEKFQGGDVDIIWNDEEGKQEIYNEQMARLIDRDGEMIFSMTPLNGITWVYTDIIENERLKGTFDFWYWPTSQNKKISQKGFKRIISNYGPKEAEVRSTGHFLNLNSGRCYYAFDRKVNVKRLTLNKSLPIRLSFDFNVNPMTTTISQIVPGNGLTEQSKVLNILEAVNTSDCNTRKQCEKLQSKLNNWKGKIIIYGDASNPRRTETADVNDTNWTIIREYFPDAEYRVPKFNPNVKERIAWCNAKIFNFDNKIGVYVNNVGCKPMIVDLEQCVWAKNGKEKDKANPALNHNSDNFDYIIAEEFKLNDFEPVLSADVEEQVNDIRSATERMGLKKNRIKIFN